MKKLSLTIWIPTDQLDAIVGAVLRQMKNIKSLTLFVRIESEYELDMLFYINLSQLEELVIKNDMGERK